MCVCECTRAALNAFLVPCVSSRCVLCPFPYIVFLTFVNSNIGPSNVIPVNDMSGGESNETVGKVRQAHLENVAQRTTKDAPNEVAFFLIHKNPEKEEKCGTFFQ